MIIFWKELVLGSDAKDLQDIKLHWAEGRISHCLDERGHTKEKIR